MDSGHAGIEQFTYLPYRELDADFELRRRVVTATFQRGRKFHGKNSAAKRCDAFDLCEIRHRENARHDRLANAERFGESTELEKVGVVVKELRDDGVGPALYFALQVD